MTVNENILLNDCVKVINKSYKGFCDIVFGNSYKQELELQHFERK